MIINGNTLEELRKLQDSSVDMCITSPPYWGLREYGSNKEEIGQENTFHEYLQTLQDIFDEVKRVLKPEGSLYVNIGDTYAGTGHKKGLKDPKNKKGRNGQGFAKNNKVKGVKNKSLIGIPDRFKINMIDSGWICRNEIIWNKPNAMPSPVKDRFTSSYEKIFFFTKSKKYYFKQQFTPYTEPVNRWGGEKMDSGDSLWDEGTGQNTGRERNIRPNPKGRNKRDVFSVNTKASKETNFAVYPRELIEPLIDASCPVGGIVLDPFAGSGTTGVVAVAQKKNYILIELYPESIELMKKKIQKEKLKPKKLFDF